MDIINLIVKSCQHIVMCRANDMEPTAFGSGCIVVYHDRKYLLSVAHVTDIEHSGACIDTGLPPVNLQTPLYSVGSMCYFDSYRTNKDLEATIIKELEDLDLEFDETLEVTFCEIKEDFQIFQPQYDFGSYTIEPGPKCYLNLHEAGEPESGKYYGFAGRVRFEVDGILIRSQPTLKLDLTYVDSFGKYHIFKTPEVITDADDYRGCSGAPILDETGKLVGLVQSVGEGTDRIYAFSIEACINLLDMAIKTNLV